MAPLPLQRVREGDGAISVCARLYLCHKHFIFFERTCATSIVMGGLNNKLYDMILFYFILFFTITIWYDLLKNKK